MPEPHHTVVVRPELDKRFTPEDHDPLIIHALLADEIVQRRETGYDVDEYVRAANLLDSDDDKAILDMVDSMTAAERGPWHWEEPDELSDIEATLPSRLGQLDFDEATYPDRVHAAWLGRIVGCNLGKPLEWGDHWTVEHIEAYLRLANAYPLTDYVPVLDPMPGEFDLNASWTESTRGRITTGARDDDVDYSILALHLLETHGAALTPEIIGNAWTSLLPLHQVFTAERAAYLNLSRGLTPPDVARFRNPYREWIGAQIRGDVYGYVKPGNPLAAARLAYQDASLSHTGNGIYGEMWAAALVASAFVSDSPRTAVEISLGVVPPKSRLADAIRHMLRLHGEKVCWDAAVQEMRNAYGHYSWVHTINNAALVTAGLLWSEGDFTTAVGRTVMGGWDTDSNAATVGSVAGILTGTANLPNHLVEPLHDRTRSALFGFDNSKISDLAERTIALTRGGSLQS